MKTKLFVSLLSLAVLACGEISTPAQAVKDVPQPVQPAAAPPGASTEPTLDAAKIAEYQKRFEEGYALQQAGKLTEARTIYDGILAEQPDAKRSLLEAGRISLKLNDLDKADAYLEKLHTIVPDFPEAIELLIQVNQALKRDIKVALLIKEFQALRANSQGPGFGQSLDFVREQIHLDADDTVIFTQYFDYTQNPNYVWQAQVVSATGAIKRQLNLFYDSKAAKEMEAKDPKLANAAQFILVEDVLKDGQISRVDAYFQMFALPEYKKIRNTMLAIIGGAYKPVYSQVIGAPVPQ